MEWFWNGFWAGLGYAASGFAILIIAVAVIGLYASIRAFIEHINH